MPDARPPNVVAVDGDVDPMKIAFSHFSTNTLASSLALSISGKLSNNHFASG